MIVLTHLLSSFDQAGLCCINMECCCKGGAPILLPFGCLGLKCECDGCSFINGQVRRENKLLSFEADRRKLLMRALSLSSVPVPIVLRRCFRCHSLQQGGPSRFGGSWFGPLPQDGLLPVAKGFVDGSRVSFCKLYLVMSVRCHRVDPAMFCRRMSVPLQEP